MSKILKESSHAIFGISYDDSLTYLILYLN